MSSFTAYVNTSSSGGDGTTNNESGSTAAFASLSAAESAMQATSIGAGEAGVINCSSGSLNNADTTVVDFAGWSINATGSLTIQGHPSSGTGRYTGDAAFSTSHYRLATTANSNSLTLSNQNITIDGIQVHLNHNNTFRAGITPGSQTGAVIQNCRVRSNAGAGPQYGIGQPGTSGSTNGTQTIQNNLVTNIIGGACISSQIAAHFTPTITIQNNTVYGANSGYGIYVDFNWASGTPVLNLRNNAVSNNTTDVNLVDMGSSTINRSNNYTDDGGSDNSLGTPSDAWTSPGTATSSDFTVKNSSSPLYNNGTSTGAPSTDIRGTSRPQGASYDVGAYELVVSSGITYEYTMSGGIDFGGAATIQKGKFFTGSGGLTFSGAATILKGLQRTGSGGIDFGGAAMILKGLARTMDGGIVFGGEAQYEYTPPASSGVDYQVTYRRRRRD